MLNFHSIAKPNFVVFFSAVCLFALSTIKLAILFLTSSIDNQSQAAAAYSHDFAIGFDLAPSYGTVAVAYPNGSTFPIAKVEGDFMYKEMMYRLSLDSSRTTHKPYRQVGDHIQDWPRHLLRSGRKKIGLPASYDVGVLSRMISSLRKEASIFVGEPINAATISIPFLPALYGEDTVDAFDYLSIVNLEVYDFKNYYPIHTASSHYLLNGHELVWCTGDSDRMTCPIDGKLLHESEFNVLTVSYTHTSLIVEFAFFSTCYSGDKYGDVGNGIANMHLGYDARHGAGGEGEYWQKVKNFLQEAVGDGWITRVFTKVAVSGDTATEARFEQTLKEVVQDMFDCKNMEYISNDPLFDGAKGTAQFALRAVDGSPYQGHSITEQAEL